MVSNWNKVLKGFTQAAFLLPFFVFSQGNVSGNMESIFQYLNDDPIIGANQPPEKALVNSYMNAFYTHGNFKAGMRL